MKSVQFQVKKRLSHEVLKVTVELSSSVRLSAHSSLSAASACLARQKNLVEHQY